MNNNVVGQYYFGGLKKTEMRFLKKYKGRDISKRLEINKIRPFFYALRHADNLCRTLGQKLTKQNIIDFLKNPKPNVPRKALNDHQATIIANIYMKYYGNRNN